MKTMTRTRRYVEARDLVGRWRLLSKQRRHYARHLVEGYGYPVMVAVQVAYIHGFDPFPYDYRAGKSAREVREPSDFGF